MLIFPKKITINTLAQLLSRGLMVLMALVSTMLLRRYLGRDGYGLYIYALNFVGIFVALSDMGTRLVAVRESSISQKEITKVVSLAAVLRGLLALAAVVLVLLMKQLISLPIELESGFVVLLLLIFFLVNKETLVVIFHAREKLYLSSLFEIVLAGLNLVLVILVIKLGWGLDQIFGGLVFNLILLVVVLGFYFFKNKYLTWIFDVKAMKKLLAQALPLGGVLVLFTIYSKIDTLLIEHFYGSSAVGAYGLAYKVYDNLVLPAAFLLNALLPDLSRLAQNNLSKLAKTSRQTLLILVAVSLLFVVIVQGLAPWIMRLLTGQQALIETYLLRILSLSLVFAFVNHLTGYLVIAFNKQKLSLLIAIVALLFNVGANWFFLPRFGVVSSAVITIATEALVLLLTSLVVIKVINNKNQSHV